MTAIDVCIGCSSRSSHFEFVPFSLHLAQSQQQDANTDGMQQTIAIQDAYNQETKISFRCNGNLAHWPRSSNHLQKVWSRSNSNNTTTVRRQEWAKSHPNMALARRWWKQHTHKRSKLVLLRHTHANELSWSNWHTQRNELRERKRRRVLTRPSSADDCRATLSKSGTLSHTHTHTHARTSSKPLICENPLSFSSMHNRSKW